MEKIYVIVKFKLIVLLIKKMETNLEKAKRLTKDNAALMGIDLPDKNFFYKMLELAATSNLNNQREF
jgi:hypothetical protein